MNKPELHLFPQSSGVYLFKDANGRILYVGKAIRLRSRLASYFRPENTLTPKTRLMVAAASFIDILQTDTEKEALLLEASLIKKHRPRYNIVLRDDKEYLLFYINDNHPYPRLEIVRKSSMKKKGSKGIVKGRFFGPFSSASAARETWKLIHKNFPLRRSSDRAFANRTRPCLYYHMGLCLGPCTLPVSQEEYRELLRKVEMLLSGRSIELVENLKVAMRIASDAMEFEKAATFRDQIKAVEHTVERQSVVLPRNTDLDIIGLSQTTDGLALGVVFIRGGLLLDGRNFFWPSLSVEDTPELLSTFLSQYYLQGRATPPKRIVVPWLPDATSAMKGEEEQVVLRTSKAIVTASTINEKIIIKEQEENVSLATLEAALSEVAGCLVTITSPKGQDEDRLMVMASSNAREAARQSIQPVMADLLAAVFKAATPIRRVEIVDISHTSGRQTRAGMVVFEDEQPAKNDYRQYSLDEDLVENDAEAGDDYAALAIWARRRAKAGAPWADLVLVDGGKGQLAAVHRAFTQAGVADEFLLASIAKARNDDGSTDRRAGNVSDRIFLPLRSNPLPLRPGSAELLFLQRMRDTAHDYVLGRHRRARSAAALTGELTRLPGIGPKTAQLLYKRFGSLAAMAEGGEEELAKVPGIGKQKARLLAERINVLVQKG